MESNNKEEISKQGLSGFELSIGRLAMVGFVGLIVGEVVSGESFSEQFIEAFRYLLGV
jgi:hypothetical protein